MSWKELSATFSLRFNWGPTKLMTFGRVRVDDNAEYKVRADGHSEGLVLSRRFRFFGRLLWIPWKMVQRIHVRPLNIEYDGARHGEAVLFLDSHTVGTLVVPWRSDFSKLAPSDIEIVKN